MKRYLSLLLLLCIAVSMLCACTDDDINPTVNTSHKNPTAQQATPVYTTTEVPIVTEPKVDYNNLGFYDLNKYGRWIAVYENELNIYDINTTYFDAMSVYFYDNSNNEVICDYFSYYYYGSMKFPWSANYTVYSNDSLLVRWDETINPPNALDTTTLTIQNRHNLNGIPILEVLLIDSESEYTWYYIPGEFVDLDNAEVVTSNYNAKRVRFNIKDEYLN